MKCAAFQDTLTSSLLTVITLYNYFTMDVKILSKTIFIENIYGIFRNYLSFSRKKRILINMRFVIELICLTFATVLYALPPISNQTSTFITYMLTFSNSFIIIVSARWHARHFQELSGLIHDNHKLFLSDELYMKRLERKYKVIKIVFVIYMMSAFLLIILKVDNFLDMNLLCYIVLVMCNIRYVFEYFMLYIELFVMSEQIKCITRAVKDSVQTIVDSSVGGDDTIQRSIREDLDRFDNWTLAYTNVKESSNLFNTIFGVQITVMLAAVMIYFILFLYEVTYISVVVGSSGTEIIIFYAVKLFVFLVALFSLSSSAQSLQDSTDALKRQLVKLLIHSTPTGVCHRATKDLLRLVSIRAVRTRAFGSVSVDMTLVPKSIMFFTTYTVIALQFNSVL